MFNQVLLHFVRRDLFSAAHSFVLCNFWFGFRMNFAIFVLFEDCTDTTDGDRLAVYASWKPSSFFIVFSIHSSEPTHDCSVILRSSCVHRVSKQTSCSNCLRAALSSSEPCLKSSNTGAIIVASWGTSLVSAPHFGKGKVQWHRPAWTTSIFQKHHTIPGRKLNYEIQKTTHTCEYLEQLTDLYLIIFSLQTTCTSRRCRNVCACHHALLCRIRLHSPKYKSLVPIILTTVYLEVQMLQAMSGVGTV